MLRPTVLASALLAFTAPALACGPAPRSAEDAARAATCPDDALAGEWIGDDGTRLRMRAPPPGGVGWEAVAVAADGSDGEPVYSDVRKGRGCRYMARRHLALNHRVHPAPPHAVMINLDPKAGRMVDDYRFGDSLGWRRATSK